MIQVSNEDIALLISGCCDEAEGSLRQGELFAILDRIRVHADSLNCPVDGGDHYYRDLGWDGDEDDDD